MSNATHTPGPWKFEEAFDDDTSCGIVIRSATDEIAQINSIGVTDFENAALLASAPDLLQSLRECIDILRDFNCVTGEDGEEPLPFYVRSLAAIARATGEQQ